MQFANYRDNYGEYQARKLMLLSWKERRSRVDFLERQLTSITDIRQPLWPELHQVQRQMIDLREQAVHNICLKHRSTSYLKEIQEFLNDFDTSEEVRDSIEGQEKSQKLRGRLPIAQEKAREYSEAAEEIIRVVRALEEKARRIKEANRIISLPSAHRGTPITLR